MPIQKLYCYVDETGQDTEGQFFLVAIVLLGKEREEIKKNLEQIEIRTGKKELRWQKTRFDRRKSYIEAALVNPLLKGKLFFSQFSGATYTKFIIEAVAKTINKKITTREYELTVFIEALGKHQRKIFASGLRRQGVKVRKVRGLRQESDVLIRLADSLAGFLRDYKEGEDWARDLFERVSKEGIIEEV